MAQLVTLQSPDGRPYRTDNASEVNLLISTYGYTRVADKNPGGGKRAKSAPAPPPPKVDQDPSAPDGS